MGYVFVTCSIATFVTKLHFPGSEKIITPLALDMKLEKGEAEKPEPRSGTGTPGPAEFPARSSGASTTLAPRGQSSPHVLASPHHDRSTDSPQVWHCLQSDSILCKCPSTTYLLLQ